MLRRRAVIVAKIEATPGTFESLTPTTDGLMNLYVPKPRYPSNKTLREKQGGFDMNPAVMGAKGSGIRFVSDYAGKGATGLPLYASTFLPCCGFALSGSTFTRTSDVSAQSTCSIAYYLDGRRHRWAGCMGNAIITAINGDRDEIEFDMQGKYLGVDDQALPAIAYPTATSIRGLATCTVMGVTPKTNRVVLDCGNVVHLREDVTDDTGFAYAFVTNALAKMTIEPEATTVATIAWEADMFASTTGSASIIAGANANNIITVAASNVEVIEVGEQGDRDGLAIDPVTFHLNTGFTIVYS